MIRNGLINMIREKSLEGNNPYAIGKELGISKNTAKKYIEQPTIPYGLKGKKRSLKLDPFKPQINEFLKQGVFNCVVIFERLQDKVCN